MIGNMIVKTSNTYYVCLFVQYTYTISNEQDNKLPPKTNYMFWISVYKCMQW